MQSKSATCHVCNTRPELHHKHAAGYARSLLQSSPAAVGYQLKLVNHTGHLLLHTHLALAGMRFDYCYC